MLKSSEYFDGNVKSIAFNAPEGPATVGVMEPGTYEFTTTSYEYMNIISGKLEVKFPDEEEWIPVDELETFEAQPNETFTVRVEADVAYFCFYSDEALASDDGAQGCGTDCGCSDEDCECTEGECNDESCDCK